MLDAVTGETFDAITQPLNGGNADLFGLEVAFQRQLDFLPGALAGLGLYTNYTFTESSLTTTVGSVYAGRSTTRAATSIRARPESRPSSTGTTTPRCMWT